MEQKKIWLKFAKYTGVALGGIALIVLLLVLGYHLILNHYIGKMNIVSTEELEYETQPIVDTYVPTGTGELPDLNPDTMIPDYNQEPDESEDSTSEMILPQIMNTEDVFHILIIGVDAQENRAGRSDTMILCSVNRKTKTIHLTSLMRDILAVFPDNTYDKLSHAHAYGGPNFLMQVLEKTFHIKVDRYVKVNFTSFPKLIDAVGGIDMNLSLEEVRYINTYIIPKKNNLLEEWGGVHHLNGLQALEHVRNRTLGSDHARANRQRTAITALIGKIKGLSLLEINEMLNTCLPLITTNISKGEWKNLVEQSLNFLNFDVQSTALPRAGTYFSGIYNGMWAMQLDLEANYRYLYETIYGAEPVPTPK